MPKKLDWKVIRDVTANVKKLMKEVSDSSYTWPHSSVDSECVFYLHELEKPSWKGILKKAQSRRKSYSTALASISDCTAKLNEMKNDFKPIERMYSLVQLPKPPRVDDAKIRKSVTRTFLKIGVSRKVINSALDKLDKSSKKNSKKVTTSSYFNYFVNEKEKLIAARKPELLKAMTAAVLAGAIAEFNLHAKNGEDKITMKSIGKWLGSSAKKMDTAESGIYKALSEKNFAKLPKSSAALSEIAQKTLEEGLRKGASALRAAEKAKASSSEAWDDICVELADVLRMALRGLALAEFLKYSVEDEQVLAYWARNAAKLAYGDIMPACKSNTIAELNELKLRTGQSVSVRGRVNDIIFIQVNKNKIVSLADIVDSGGNHISAVLPYIKINSCGLVPGSSVRITGTFDPQAVKKHLQRVIPKAYKQKVAALNPKGLVIDRLNYGELSKKSWQNWVTRELGFMFTAVPHGLNMSWSWQPGNEGPGNQLCFGTWCGR